MKFGFIKIGESLEISPSDVQEFSSVSSLVSEDIILEFKKTASQLKKIAPKADDFLYFSAVMMHAAEAVSINEDGTPKLNVRGEQIKVSWDKNGGTWRWKSNDPNLKPYKNSNGDIFPEEELIRAHKKWIGKPLCIDHKSSSVDHVRGFIVDTYYDRKLKRVIALCALDKHNYPDLARKVSTGYSNSVSMGTAVGKAICYDCATVAKTEADFCKCMRNKSCYGEINVDLNPIELSIVVNGADPQAKIKHIIAAANSLNAYVDQKEQELKKLAEVVYSASVTVSDSSKDPQSSNYNLVHSINTKDIEEFRRGINDALQSVEEFRKEMPDIHDDDLLESENHSENHGEHDDNSEEDGEDLSALANVAQSNEHKWQAEFNLAANELGSKLDTIKNKLEHIQGNLNKLSSTVFKTNQKEEIMSGTRNDNLNKRGYFQGGGGVNEPTPGQAKYEKDPLNEELRENGDKQMVGHTPFPDVGSVDDLYPGLSKSDLETKKMLARAQAEERAAKRAELVSRAKDALNKKQAYFQGGGEGNEPTPGKRKYTPDPMNEDLRDSEDKQMVGQKPFPEVGKVDGLHPSPASAPESDELKRKQMLSRAGYSAKFIKAANVDGSHDPANSLWQVYNQDGSLVFTASVNELSGGKSAALYAGIATESFGKDLIKKVRAFGSKGTKALYKSAQEVPAAPAAPAAAAPAAPAPEAAPPAADAGAMPEPEVKDEGKSGDSKEVVMDLAQKISTLASDLIEAVRVLTGEQAEMGDLAELSGEAGGDKVTTASLQNMRKELNGALISAMKESIATLRDHEGELKTISSIYKKGSVNSSNKDMVDSLVDDAVVDAKEAVADAFKLLEAFVKYARGTEAIVKRAQDAEMAEELMSDDMDMDFDDELSASDEDDVLTRLLNEDTGAEDKLDGQDRNWSMHFEDQDEADDASIDSWLDEASADDVNMADAGTAVVNNSEEAADVMQRNPNAKVEIKKANLDLNTKAGRAAYRAKLAAELKFNPILEDSSKHTKKTKGDLGDVETVEEVHEKMMDVAKAPVKVRKEAEAIQQLIAEGKITPSDFPALIANGLDEEAVKYWKEFFGEAGPEGSEFAKELVKEHVKAKADEEMSAYRVKLARAYELAYEMLDRGLIARDRGALASQVEEVMKWNDESFDSVKRLVAKHSPTNLTKQAGRIPQVGVFGAESALPTGGEDLESQLAAAFSKSNKRFF